MGVHGSVGWGLAQAGHRGFDPRLGYGTNSFYSFQKSEKEKPSTGEEKKPEEKTDKPPEEKKPEEKKEGEGEKKPEEPKVRCSKGYCSF